MMKDKLIKISNEIKKRNIILLEKINQDYENNSEYFNTLCKLIYNKEYTGKFNFSYLRTNFHRKNVNYSYEIIDNVQLKIDDKYDINDESLFFKKIIFSKIEEMDNLENNIYICDNTFLKNIDKYLLDFYNNIGYTNSKKGIFQKVISENFKIVINTNVSYRLKYGFKQPNDYEPPVILFYINGINVNIRDFFTSELSLNLRLIFPFKSSYLFNIFFIDFNKKDLLEIHNEPKVTYNLNSKNYTLQNSTENIIRFNKFIYIYIELYKHYYLLFEKWIIDDVQPYLDTDLDFNLDTTDGSDIQ